MIDVAKLQAEHREIMQVANQLARLFEQSSAPSVVQLYELRTQLTSHLTKHLKTEDWILYPALLKSRDQKTVRTAQRLKDRVGGFSEIYAQHCSRWHPVSIALEWDLYREASLKLLEVLRDRIEGEERELFPLVDAGVTTETLSIMPIPEAPRSARYSRF